LKLGGRDFELVLDKGLLFVAMSEMNIGTRLDSYITNFTMPWDKKPTTNSGQSQVYATVGALVCYKVKLSLSQNDGCGDNSDWEFSQFWVKTFGF